MNAFMSYKFITKNLILNDNHNDDDDNDDDNENENENEQKKSFIFFC